MNIKLAVVICWAVFSISGCVAIGQNRAQSSLGPNAEGNNVANQSGLINANLGKLAEDITGLEANIGKIQTNVKGIEAKVGNITNQMDTQIKGIENRMHTQLENVATSISASFDTKITGIENRIETKISNQMDTKISNEMGIVGNQVVTSVTGTLNSHIETLNSRLQLWEKHINLTGTAGGDLDQSQNKYGGLLNWIVTIVALLTLPLTLWLARGNSVLKAKNASLENQVRAIQRGLIHDRHWSAPPKDNTRRAMAPGVEFDPRDVAHYNWSEFAPSSKKDKE